MITFTANPMLFSGHCRLLDGLPAGRMAGFTINTKKSTIWIFKSKIFWSRYESLFDAIVSAHQQLRPRCGSRHWSAAYCFLAAMVGCELYLKCDHLQHTGSFKFRGASNRLRLLDNEQRRRGVIAASTGNHGQAVALAGTDGVGVTVCARDGREHQARHHSCTGRHRGIGAGRCAERRTGGGNRAHANREKPISRRITTSR